MLVAGTLTSSTQLHASTETDLEGIKLMKYSKQNVKFESGGIDLAGILFLPYGQGPHPAVAVMGPVAFVKEQSPVQYASRLARMGVATLIFDPRYHGASGGEPRRFESGTAKIEDLSAAVTYLTNHKDIAPDRIGLLGICQGVNWAIEASNQDPRVKALGLVAGHYLMPETAVMYLGDQSAVEARADRSATAQALYKETGEVQYISIVGSDDALLTHQVVDDWYSPWANHASWFTFRGLWENRIAAMSEAGIWGWRTDEKITNLKTPVLMIHGDKAATGADLPQRLFNTIPSDDKSMVWINGVSQIQFYEDPLVIDAAVDVLSVNFLETL
jgi:dienelactone hydrolase